MCKGVPITINKKEVRFDYDRDRRLACAKLLDEEIYRLAKQRPYVYLIEPYASRFELALESMVGLVCLFKEGKRP